MKKGNPQVNRLIKGGKVHSSVKMKLTSVLIVLLVHHTCAFGPKPGSDAITTFFAPYDVAPSPMAPSKLVAQHATSSFSPSRLSKIYFKYKNASPTARLHGAPLAQPPSVPYLRQPAECTSVYAKLHCCNIHTPLRLFYRFFPFPISSKAPITQNCRPIWCYCRK